MKKKMMKAINDLNAYIDNDRKKLCDELHEVKLSHKRLEKLVVAFVKVARSEYMDMKYLVRLVAKAENELAYPYLRRNWGYTHKQEPGHYCDN